MGNMIELDVRPYLKKKLEPFQLIMETVKGLSKEDLFVLHATFKPTPLLGLMKTKGYHNQVVKMDAEHWTVTFAHKSMKHLLQQKAEAVPEEPSLSMDNVEFVQAAVHEPRIFKLNNRGLEPPQPMIRTLAKLNEALAGDQVIIHNDRVPMFLIEELNTLGYSFTVADQADGSAIVTITKS